MCILPDVRSFILESVFNKSVCIDWDEQTYLEDKRICDVYIKFQAILFCVVYNALGNFAYLAYTHHIVTIIVGRSAYCVFVG